MSRATTVAIAMVVLAAVALLVIGSHVLERDRAELRRSYAEERLHAVQQAAANFAGDVEEIDEDLELAATLLSRSTLPAVRERELHAIATIKRAYLAAELSDADGTPLASVIADDAPPDILVRVGAQVDATVRQAREQPGQFKTSPPLSGEPGELAWYRVFARSSPRHDGLVVALVVDLRPLLSPLRLLEDSSSALLVIGAHGQPAPTSSPTLAAQVHALQATPTATPALARLMDLVRARSTGWLTVAPREARRLGLPDAPAVAATAPVLIEDGEPWALAVVASTSALSGQERTLLRRMLAGGAVGIALVLALSIYVVRNARRAAALHEQLQLRRVEERLLHSEKLVTAGQLAAGIAHELGTPLNVIRARAELAIDRLGDHPEARSQHIVVEQVDHVSRLIAQLLDYVRSAPPLTQPVAVAPALASVAGLLAVEAERRGVKFTVDAAEVPPLRADPGQLQQVLVNLAMNALDACERGGRVRLRARPGDDTTVALEVEDDGHGIAPEARAQVFDPFYTTKKRGQGTGLGLWVVAQIVRAHDAHIDLDGRPGAGTLVRVTWPAAT